MKHNILWKDTELMLGWCSNCQETELKKRKQLKNGKIWYWYACRQGLLERDHKRLLSVRYIDPATGKQKRQTITDKPEVCEICGQPGRICFDHDHATGKFRGWLCDACNRALGYAKDNPRTLRKLAYYLERQKND